MPTLSTPRAVLLGWQNGRDSLENRGHLAPAGYLQLHERLAIPVGISVGILTVPYIRHVPSVVQCC